MPGLVEEHHLAEIAARPSSPLTQTSRLVPSSRLTAVFTDPSRCDLDGWRRSSLLSPCLHSHHRTFLSPEAQRSDQTELSESRPAGSLLAAVAG